MSPKPKYTREEIINAAYGLTREKGIDAVVAREVGKRLNTSATPIFTVWNSMDELKNEVLEKAKQKYREYMADIFDYSPAFKEFGMRWVSFAAKEPNLYRLLFLPSRDMNSPYFRFKQEFESILTPLIEEIRKTFDLSEDNAEDWFNQMAIFANGLAAFVITDPDSFSEDEVSRSISICIGIVIEDKLSDGTISIEDARGMARSGNETTMPQKKRANDADNGGYAQ